MKGILHMALTLALAGATWVSTGPAFARGLSEARDQGILYFKRGHYKQARSTLDEAYKMPGGAADFQVVFFRASALYEVYAFGECRKMVTRARSLAKGNADRLARVNALAEELAALVSAVRLEHSGQGPDGGVIHLELKTGIINKRKGRIARDVKTRLATTHTQLPAVVYLPFGEYTANGVPFVVARGETTEVELMAVADAEVAPVASGGSNTWLYVGLGAAVVAAAGVGTFLLLDQDEEAPPPELLFNVNSLRQR